MDTLTAQEDYSSHTLKQISYLVLQRTRRNKINNKTSQLFQLRVGDTVHFETKLFTCDDKDFHQVKSCKTFYGRK
jgi:hypothetical protein